MPVTDPRGNGAVQLVVTDLDGTLSDAAERIHPASVRAIRDLEAGGVPVLVATGRRLRMACAVLEAGGLTGPAVVLDGALGLDLRDGRVFHQVAFPAPAAAKVLEAFDAAGLSPCVYVDRDGVDLVVGDHPSTHPGHRARARPWVAVDDLARVVPAEAVYTFAVVGRPAPLLEPVLQLVGTAGSASIVDDLIYGGSTLQVRPPRISKWSGVLAFCAEQGIDPGRVLAVGDGANDLELLESAAVACVVATAAPAIQAQADHLIGPPDAGGWAAVLELAGRPVGDP
ncbi:MAG TPA: HAD family hydrolase [Actinomycetota bacterium]|nr:HAD family hydrolase [Actinomycetota bacterium]